MGPGFYPHNSIFEVMMATGLVGLVCFGNWLYNVFKAARKIINQSQFAWTLYLLIQYFILGLTSYSVFTNSYFWYFSAIVIWLGQKTKKNA
ncbi:hypothetical protein D6B99_10475 [Arachidicoccus soli]|uniref:Uncharacterized protein n=1 Tax=Arachidicoccus soli TaxID=2341117 RepID=A0A386HPV0_9BACT|nr:hypothetical protein D6B99_10475 [Arachidicoccus soli]